MPNKEKYESHFLNLFSIALSDNNVDVKEMELLYDIGIKKGFSNKEIDYIINNPHKVKFIKPETLEESIDQLYDVSKMIWADGKIDVREINAFKNYSKHINIRKDKIDDIIDLIIESVKVNEEKKSSVNKIKNILES